MLHDTTHHTANFLGAGYEPHNSGFLTARSSQENGSPPLPSESLLRGHKIVEILHNGSLYKLQATKLGKLILTK